MNHKESLDELYSMNELEFEPGLKNMKALLKKLGNPEKKLRCIHVAGTNGKGSVCAMVSSVLADAGYNVGMYTSPHLKKFNERIKMNRRLISDKDVAEYYLKIKKYITNQSFFEITTAMAFLYFYDKNADFVVLEAGLGGRLDSTNVVKPLISVITNISYEHTDRLGKTLRKIAYEKSGIIKNHIPIVTGASGIALRTIKRIAKGKNSKLHALNEGQISKRFNKKKNEWSFDFGIYKNLSLSNLKGKFQVKNAAIAVKALEILNRTNKIKITYTNIKNGLSNAEWPGRFQYIEKNVLVDSAHNPGGFKVLFDELKNISYNRLILLVGFSKDKDVKKISQIISSNKKIGRIILTQSNNEKSMPIEDAKRYFKDGIAIRNSKKALECAKKTAKKNDLVLVCGSIYLLGKII